MYISKDVKSILAALTIGALLGVAATPITKPIYDKYFSNKNEMNKAIIYNDNKAIVVNVSEWNEYNDALYEIETTEGENFMSLKSNTEIISEANMNSSIEDYIRAIKGEDIEIEYLEKSYTKTK